MKTLLIFLAAPLMAATAMADWVIESKIESPQINSNTIMKIKGDKLRMDFPSGPLGAMSSIVDTKTGDTLQLVHGQKMAIKASSAQTKQLLDVVNPHSVAKAGVDPVPKTTGQSEKVGDYDCEIYTWTDGTSTTRLWMARNHPQAAALKAVEKQLRAGFLGATSGGPDTSGLPGPVLRTEKTTAEGKSTSSIVSVKEQPVDAKEFEAPADYQTMAMPALPGGQ